MGGLWSQSIMNRLTWSMKQIRWQYLKVSFKQCLRSGSKPTLRKKTPFLWTHLKIEWSDSYLGRLGEKKKRERSVLQNQKWQWLLLFMFLGFLRDVSSPGNFRTWGVLVGEGADGRELYGFRRATPMQIGMVPQQGWSDLVPPIPGWVLSPKSCFLSGGGGGGSSLAIFSDSVSYEETSWHSSQISGGSGGGGGEWGRRAFEDHSWIC